MDEQRWLRLIGDIHGERKTYIRLVTGPAYSIQLGDLDFEYDWLSPLAKDRHRFLPGNHDNYDFVPYCPHSLGDYGVTTIPDFGDIFFVRGGFSIDHKARVSHDVYKRDKLVRRKDFWEEEEMSAAQLMAAIKLYQEVKPKMIIAHEAPLMVVPYVTNPMMTHSWGYRDSVIKTKTNQALQVMVESHQPKVFVFGHYHATMDKWLDKTGGQMPVDTPTDKKGEYTRYICLNILKYMDFPKNFVNEL